MFDELEVVAVTRDCVTEIGATSHEEVCDLFILFIYLFSING